MTEEETIRDGLRVKQFLEDDAVVAAFARLEARYYADYKAAKSDEQLKAIHARTVVLDDLKSELAVVVENGMKVKADHERRTRRSVG